MQILIDSQSEDVKKDVDAENYDPNAMQLIEKKMTYDVILTKKNEPLSARNDLD